MSFEVAARMLENPSTPAPVTVLQYLVIKTYRGIAAYTVSVVT